MLVVDGQENTVSGRAWLDDLTEAAEARGLRVLTPPVPKRVVIADAVEASKGLDEWGSAEATALSGLCSGHLTTLEELRPVGERARRVRGRYDAPRRDRGSSPSSPANTARA